MQNTNQPNSALSPFAARMLTALQKLTKECEPHPCGGFTSDDMQWRMGTAFTPDKTLWETLDELTTARLIRHCGDDDEDAIGTCYELLPPHALVSAPAHPLPTSQLNCLFLDPTQKTLNLLVEGSNPSGGTTLLG
jgi:hypothetical protein